jgi:hypothetical protein
MNRNMKRIFLILLALASLANAQAVDEWTFFSGAHLGMTIDECSAYYSKAIADAGSAWHSGAPEGEQIVDFRTNSSGPGGHSMLRVFVYTENQTGKSFRCTIGKWEKMKYSPKRRCATSLISVADRVT